MSFLVTDQWFDTPPDPVTMCVRWSKDKDRRDIYTDFRMTGTLEALVLKYLENWDEDDWEDNHPPAGIWIDRLQEEPSELIGASQEQVEAILLHLRERHPNGV